MIKFFSLASGSSGNCYYLASSHIAILIDAGIGVRTIRKMLKERGIDLSDIRAVLVTHDHVDHIRAVGALGERFHIPIYSTREVHAAIMHSCRVSDRLRVSACYVEKEQPFMLGDMRITAFEVPHDSRDNVGYLIEIENERFCIATDVGHLTDTIVSYLSQAHYLILEANYDETMLRMGHYPQHLKERIASPTGHLSNREVAAFLVSHYSPMWKYVWLCHLSKENNHPELVLKTIEIHLREIGVIVGEDLQVIPLRRITPSPIYQFGKAKQELLFKDED